MPKRGILLLVALMTATMAPDSFSQTAIPAAMPDILGDAGSHAVAPMTVGRVTGWAVPSHQTTALFDASLLAGVNALGQETSLNGENGSGAAPSLSIDNVTVFEDAGPLVFLVSLSEISNQDVSVDFATANGTATSPGDYSARSGRLTIPAGYGSAVLVFGNIGDYGDAGDDEENVANMLKAKNPAFIFTNGDNNYPDGEESTWFANVMQYYSEFISATNVNANQFYASLGNHDYHVFPSAFLNGLALPAGQGNERYYDIVKGPVHLFCLDSNSSQPDGRTSTSVQGQWLQDRLAASSAPWKLVFFHHAPFSSALNHGSQNVMQWPFDAWGADAIFAGHDHVYERLLKDEDSDGAPIAYFVNGLGGKSRYSFDAALPESVVRYRDDFGAMVLRADDDAIIYEFYAVNDGLLDRYVVTRPGAPAPPHLVTVPIIDDDFFEPTETFSVVLSNVSNATIADAAGVATILDNDVDAGAEPDAVAVALPDTTGDSGSSILIPIRVGDLSGQAILAYQTTVTFDPGILTAVGAVSQGTLSEVWGTPIVNTHQPGSITVASFGATALSGSGILVYLQFDIIGQSAQTTPLTPSAFFFNSGNPPVTIDNGSLTVTSPVPVELAAFSAERVGKGVRLTWRTESESNNLGFAVQKSADGEPYQTIGFVPGHGTTTVPHNYQFFDEDKDSGICYYRLQQFDADGTTTFSTTIAVKALTPVPFVLENYPNPFNSQTTIEFYLADPAEIQLIIYDINGRRVRTLAAGLYNAGSHSLQWDSRDETGQDVASGLYFCSFRSQAKTMVRSMLLLR